MTTKIQPGSTWQQLSEEDNDRIVMVLAEYITFSSEPTDDIVFALAKYICGGKARQGLIMLHQDLNACGLTDERLREMRLDQLIV